MNISEKIEEYKKIIREKGSKEAARELRKRGGLYRKDFTKSHKNDETFSDKKTEELVEEKPTKIELKTQSVETRIFDVNSGGTWLVNNPEPTDDMDQEEKIEVYSS